MREKINLLAGEVPIENAPLVPISQQENCIPQHYLKFEHRLETVEQLILDISFSDRFPIFVGEENGQLYLQVGIVGIDNYQPASSQNKDKIVFGRKWRVEPQLPTSEIIQTAFLALQKAREHEIRELFKINQHDCVTTPFNNHHDLPLMAQSRDWMRPRLSSNPESPGIADVEGWLACIRYDHARLELSKFEKISENIWLIGLNIIPNEATTLPELVYSEEMIVVKELSQNVLYLTAMDRLLAMSNEYVEEYFSFKGFNRFSRQHSVLAIGQLSAKTRSREANKVRDKFSEVFSEVNYEVDKSRVPQLTDSPLSRKITQQLASLNVELTPVKRYG